MFGENCITAERLLVEFGVYAPQLRSQKKFSTLVLKINPPPVPNGKTLTLAKILNHPPPPAKILIHRKMLASSINIPRSEKALELEHTNLWIARYV